MSSEEEFGKGNKYIVGVKPSSSPSRRAIVLILVVAVALVAVVVLLATLIPIYVTGNRDEGGSKQLSEQQGDDNYLTKSNTVLTIRTSSPKQKEGKSLLTTDDLPSEMMSPSKATYTSKTLSSMLPSSNFAKSSAKQSNAVSATATATASSSSSSSSSSSTTTTTTTTAAAITTTTRITSSVSRPTTSALRMSLKAVDPNQTLLECTSTAKTQQLEQTITQITQEVAALKSCACSSPGTKAHTLIKPVTSQSIASDGSGKGTSQDPYKIASIQDLQKLRSVWKNNTGKYFIVTQNINLSSIANFAPLPRFEGILDGNNKTILNLKIDGTHLSSQIETGLFERIERTGQVKNLRLENVLVKGAQNVGGLAGYHYGRIDNSYVTGKVLGTKKYHSVGGLVGTSYSRITDSYATAKVSGPHYVGGLVGILYEGTIQSCYATGTVSGIGNTTNLSGTIGGLVGYNDGTILSSCATGDVSGHYIIGGLVGDSSSHITKINNSYATGNVSGTGIIGGLVGDSSGTITKCYAIGQVSGSNRVGGLVGRNRGRIDNSFVTGQVLGTDYTVGGLVGRSVYTSSRITDSYATANVSGRSSVGGLVGELDKGTIQRCYATGTVSGIDSQIGGLVGGHYGTILSSYATGDVSGQSYIGGLVGLSSSGHHIKINNSYATGDISGTRVIGGLVGDNEGSITKCYAIGQVSGSDEVGGLVGENTGSIDNSYGKQQFGTTNILGAKTDTELKTPTTFTGWNTCLWKLIQNQFPKLKRLLN